MSPLSAFAVGSVRAERKGARAVRQRRQPNNECWRGTGGGGRSVAAKRTTADEDAITSTDDHQTAKISGSQAVLPDIQFVVSIIVSIAHYQYSI